MKLAVIAVGTELTEGRIPNTNAAWISKRFLRIGVETALHVAVPDDRDLMRRAFAGAAERADIVVVTGGLGPTVDDITRDVAAELAGVPLEEDAGSVAWLERVFAKLGRPLSANNRRQATFPRGARILRNRAGTAPGFALDMRGARFFFVPGVPHESEKMLEESVVPDLEREVAAAGGAVLVRRIDCFGLAESRVDAVLAPLFPGPDPALAFNVSDGVVQIYLTARAPDRAAAEARLAAGAEQVREALGGHVYGQGEGSLEEALLAALRARGLTFALAESCTGGMAAARIVRVPGASDVFLGGFVAYANHVKRDLLGVAPATLEAHGAVSRECALEMARGARRALGASIAAAITGIAGPSGGTPEKPVGLVYVAAVSESEERCRELRLPGWDRGWIQRVSAMNALDQGRRLAMGMPESG